MKNVNWTRVLTILLVILASLALLYVASNILVRFAHALLIFTMGAMVAYVLTPVVNSLTVVVRARWLAILFTYLLIGFFLFLIAVLLFTPFVQQSRSLVDNLHTPSSGSLGSVSLVQKDAQRVEADLASQVGLVTAGLAVSAADVARVQGDISTLDTDIVLLGRGTFYGPRRGFERGVTVAGRQPPEPQPQTNVPPSYVKPLALQSSQILAKYTAAMSGPTGVRSPSFAAARDHVRTVVTLASALHDKVSKTPILLLRAQQWVDQRGLTVDLYSKFGDAARQLSDQGALLLDNAVAILSGAANLLVNTILILIIAFYMMSDGRRMLHRAITIIPESAQEQVSFFLLQLDKVLGGYIRGQLFLSALAGVLGGAGAAALGVPYPLLIGIMTFLLESVPVMGPLVAFIPPVAIALVFTTPVTTLLLFIWFTVFQQIVTNFLGPKIMGTAVGIHPLEAIGAVLVGYPLGGFIGAFLAVPVAGILHILIRELYAYFALGRALPTAPVMTAVEGVETSPGRDVPPVTPSSETHPAPG